MTLNIELVGSLGIPIVTPCRMPSPPSSQDLLDLIANNRNELIAQLEYYGGVLFRGFHCYESTLFSDAIEHFKLGRRCSTTDYDLPRTLLPDEIYTSSDLPGHIPLPLHHEKPRSKNPPRHIYFCCVTPAAQGGGTLFANASVIWPNLPSNIQSKITEHGVLYQQFFYDKSLRYQFIKKTMGPIAVKSWADYYHTNNKTTIEHKLSNNETQWKWINHGKHLVLWDKLPGVMQHPVSKQQIWFNSAAYLNHYTNLIYGELHKLPYVKYLIGQYLILKDRLPLVCHYGNGQAFSHEEIIAINQTIQQHTYIQHWQKGDFMVVDNYTFMHGKQPHQGNRLLYSCMTA